VCLADPGGLLSPRAPVECGPTAPLAAAVAKAADADASVAGAVAAPEGVVAAVAAVEWIPVFPNVDRCDGLAQLGLTERERKQEQQCGRAELRPLSLVQLFRGRLVSLVAPRLHSNSPVPITYLLHPPSDPGTAKPICSSERQPVAFVRSDSSVSSAAAAVGVAEVALALATTTIHLRRPVE